MKRMIRASKHVYSNSQLGSYKGVTYGIEDNPPMRYYFIKQDGTIEYAETEDEVRDKIDVEFE